MARHTAAHTFRFRPEVIIACHELAQIRGHQVDELVGNKIIELLAEARALEHVADA